MDKALYIFCFIPLFLSCTDDEGTVFSPQQQLLIDIRIIDQYLADNEIEANADVSGLRYIVNEEGEGDQPTDTSTVTIKYVSRLLTDGRVVDSNNDGITFPLDRQILGWQVGIPLIKEGGDITLYVPSPLVYGPSGSGAIPGNEVLVFDIELLSVN